jgi:hypothetical protein
MITLTVYGLFDLLATDLPLLDRCELEDKGEAISARAAAGGRCCAAGCGQLARTAVIAEAGLITGATARWLDLCPGCFTAITRLCQTMPTWNDELAMFDLYSQWAEDRRGGPLPDLGG